MEIEDSQLLHSKRWPPEARPQEKLLLNHLIFAQDRHFRLADEGLL